MLYYAAVFIVIAVVAAVLGLGGLAVAAALARLCGDGAEFARRPALTPEVTTSRSEK
jgi:hypothetical protein